MIRPCFASIGFAAREVIHDKKIEKPYYYNSKTGESTWTRAAAEEAARGAEQQAQEAQRRAEANSVARQTINRREEEYGLPAR